MKNKLLLTTALVAVSFTAANAWANTEGDWDGNSFYGVTGSTAAKKVTGDVTANNVTVENNSNTSGGVGGAVYVQVPDGGTPAGNLTLNGGVFSNNHSKFDGGAIGNYGNLVVNRTIFKNNRAQFESKDSTTVSSDSNHPIGGGAISLGAQSHTYIQGAEFTGNKSGADGGAIGTRLASDANVSGAELTVENSTFTGNEGKWGGAISNAFSRAYGGQAGEGVLLKNNTFSSNSAMYGGALSGLKDSKTIILGGSFTDNKATAPINTEKEKTTTEDRYEGGAIWTSPAGTNGNGNNRKAGELMIDGTSFARNEATTAGGAIFAGGNAKILNATFDDNNVTGSSKTNNSSKAAGGGALFVAPSAQVDIDNAWFTENSSDSAGGAIANGPAEDDKDSNGTNGHLHVNNSHFVKNHAGNSGGAINVASDKQKDVKITNSEFDGNYSTNGGAIYTKGEVTISNSVFTNNRADKNTSGQAGVGGAILNSGGQLTMDHVIFKNNVAANDGGALYGNKAQGSSPSISITNGAFIGNTATNGNGGAIFAGQEESLSLENVTFEDNTAKGAGGAISTQASSTTFKGNNVFKNNKAGDKKNDINIVNSSTVTLADGASLTLDGGITGKSGTLNVGNGSILNVKDTTTVESKVTGTNGIVQVVVTDKTMENGQLKLVGTDGIFTNTTSSGSSASMSPSGSFRQSTPAEDMFDRSVNNLYAFEKEAPTQVWGSRDVSYTVKERSTGDIANRLGVKNAEAATLLATSSSKSGTDTFGDIQDTLRSAAQYGHDSDSLSRAADALVADAAPVVQTRETALSNMIFDAASDALDDNLQNAAVGQSSGDSLLEKAKVWVKGLFNYADRDETSKARGFDIDTYGVAMGADKEVGAGKVGLGYAYSQSDINGYTRDTDVDTHSVFLYGQYKPADWYVKGVAAYSWSDYEEKKSVLGHDAKAKYDVDTLALEGLYGYNFHVGDGYDITPEGGLRYLHASQDSYTNGLGVRVKDRDIDVLTAVAGVKAAKNFALSNGMNIRPEVRAALTYDLSTDDNESSVVLTNGQAIKVDGEELDRFGFEFGAKLATDITSNWEVSAGYEGRFREDYSDHTGILSAKYKF